MNSIKVLIVDDSALMRQMLTHMLTAPGIQVVGQAADPLVARQMIRELSPDVLTLDVEMPRMDGLSFLEKLMSLRPMPVVMVSSLTAAGADATLRALELGAVDFVTKPKLDLQRGMPAMADELLGKVRAAASSRVRQRPSPGSPPVLAMPGPGYRSSEKIVAIGASTGGVEALGEVLAALPADSPAVLIAQHMPPKFTASMAQRLDRLSQMRVSEAVHGARVLPGHAYVAPGGLHLNLARSGANYICHLNDGPAVSGHKPSVDSLFRSVADQAGANAIGVILTGMGRDGAEGMQKMRQAGALTLGQDEASCVVYGMPKAARELGAVDHEWPLVRIPAEILRGCAAKALRI